MIDNLYYLISSHIDYSKPLNNLLKSMESVPGGNIFVVRGGSNHEYTYELWNGITIAGVEHNSFDYTALIWYMDWLKNSSVDHIFLLQDTMEFHSGTDQLIRSANPDLYATAVWGGQCNLVLYRRDFLMQNEKYIMSLVNCNKRKAIEEEGALFRKAPEDKRSNYPGGLDMLGTAYPYGATKRLVELYSGIDLIKYKANFDGLEPKIGRFITDP